MDQDRPNLAVLNILMLTIVGIGASSWVLYYTDFFPVVTGLLGLGGLFAWVAFLLNVLSSERKKSLETIFDVYCLQSPAFLMLLGGLPLLAAVVFAPAHGTLVIDNLEAKEGRVVLVSTLGPDGKLTKRRRVPVAAGSRVKVLVKTKWFGSGEYYLRPNGLPAARVTVRALGRETVDIPYIFIKQPVLLVRPQACLVTSLKEGLGSQRGLTIQVMESVGAHGQPQQIAREPYNGGTAWIGCDENVTIPQTTIDRWRLELKLANLDNEVVNWITPIALAPMADLAASTVTVNLLRPSGEVAFHTTVEVPREVKQFPKEVVLPCSEPDSV